MAWVERTGGQSWRVRFRDHSGQLVSVGGFGSEREAADHAAELDEGHHRTTTISHTDRSMTVEAWAGRWLPTLNVSERTEENYRRELRNHVLPHWGDRQLASITGTEVHAWEGQLHATGYAPTTVASYVKLLSRLLGDAADARLIPENPARRRPHRGPRVLRPVAEKVWATPEQALQVAEHATALGGATVGLLIVTAGWTGMRWGEIAGLQRSNLNIDKGLLVVDRYVGGLHESSQRMWLGPPKTAASIRVVTLPPFLIDLLAEHLDRTDGVPVFAGPGGGWLRRSNVDRRIMRPAADGTLDQQTASIRLPAVRPGLTLHRLRHSHKTWLIADGVPEIAQARRLGHHLQDRVVETYSHVAPEVEQRLLDGLEARWHAANAYLHPREPQHNFQRMLTKISRWRQQAA